MRLIPLVSGAWLALTLALGSATAGEPWVYVGELHFPKKGVVGKLSVNLDSMRRRSRHYEIWERITFDAGPPGQSAAEEGTAERMTLWAIRCGRGAMAKLTERLAGSFLPRNEALRFHVPSPESSGAAVIETACAEARRRFAEDRLSQGQESPKGTSDAGAVLDRPPSVLDEDLDDGDE